MKTTQELAYKDYPQIFPIFSLQEIIKKRVDKEAWAMDTSNAVILPRYQKERWNRESAMCFFRRNLINLRP